MSIRVSLVHACFDQARILAFMEPFLFLAVPKEEFSGMWREAAEKLGQVRKLNCRCSYRVTTQEADILVKNGVADYLITEWRWNEEKKTFFPAPNPNLVWGGKQAEEWGLVRSSYAGKTPRVQTVEKAHIERSYIDNRADEAERIEIWGELSRQVITNLTTYYETEPRDPFKGCPVISVAPGYDPRTCPGKTIQK